MNDAKYIGLDVHQATISVAVWDSAGKLVMEAILETKAETISETTSSLSVSDRVRSIPGIFSGGGRPVLETLWFESESQLVS
jgi:hypothetical protein